MKLNFLEEIGGVKTARKEAESIHLAKALLQNRKTQVRDAAGMLKFVKKNKVLLRASALLPVPREAVEEAEKDSVEAFDLYNHMSDAFAKSGVPFVAIKSFDSLPDIGHDIDLLVPDPSELKNAEQTLLKNYKAAPAELTHCDKLLGKFSCFLPGYKHDFEIYPTISQLGEIHLNPMTVLNDRREVEVEGHKIWMTSDSDRVLIRVIHAMYRHNFLKLSDILDFLKLIEAADENEVIEKMSRARIGDAFIFYLASIERFLKACQVENKRFQALQKAAREKFGSDRLSILRRDRLVLPYRIPTVAIILLFLLKGGREVALGRLKSAILCFAAPTLILLDFASAAVRSDGRGRVW